MLKVKKRDGSLEQFKVEKIGKAIERAFMAEHKFFNQDIVDMLSLRVTADFNSKIKEETINIEDIQDSVEVVLIQAGYVDVARSYIIYRKQHQQLREIRATNLDYKNVIDNYLKINDWRVKENSTVTYSVGGLILSNSGAVTANYWLSEIYDPEISAAHRQADIHIHDLSMLTGYCAGWSLKQLIQEGLGGVVGKITSSPANHLSTLCNQMVNFLGIMQNEWAGAQAFSSFDTYLAPFVKKDNLSFKEVKQCIQSFVYGVNTPSRWGTQAPFSNITLDWVVPNDMAELNCLVGGKEMPFKYKDCVNEMAMINKAFIEVMIEGDANGRGFQYPIPTYSITKTFDWSETENNKLLFEMTAKYGTPYFSNYVNSDMEPSDVRSMCCRLRLDLRELRKKSGGFFGSGESTGSVGVVTINMPRLAYLAIDEKDFYTRLDKIMDISARSLKVKRNTITALLDAGLYPYTKRYLGSFSNHFSTIGLVGMNEACLNARWIKKDLSQAESIQFTKAVLNHMRERLSDYQELYGDLYNLEATPAESTAYRLAKHDKEQYPYTKRYLGSFSNHFSTIGLVGMNEACLNARWIKKDLSQAESIQFTKAVLNHMRERLSDYQESYGDLYNLEATPAESTAYRLAKHDKEQYPNIITASEEGHTPYYTNSSHLPVSFTSDIYQALDVQDGLQTLYTSGTVFHAFLGQKLPSWKSCMNLVKKIAENYHIPYYTMSPTYSICKEHGYLVGEQFTCPHCGQETEVYSRITGYYRPVRNWNDGKTEEYKNREKYNIDNSKLPHSVQCDKEVSPKEKTKPTPKELLLFATKTCANCKMAKMLLDKDQIKYTVIDAEEERDLTEQYNITKAPTLIVPTETGYDVYENASNIKGYIESLKKHGA